MNVYEAIECIQRYARTTVDKPKTLLDVCKINERLHHILVANRIYGKESKLLVTAGELGFACFDPTGSFGALNCCVEPHINHSKVKDVSGAGDAIVSALACRGSCGKDDLIYAAEIASLVVNTYGASVPAKAKKARRTKNAKTD
jgi:sugar/nucleoside kinase (ribokinase family)